MSELNEVKEKIDVTGQEYNWRNARKYQTSNNPEFLKRIEKLKVECLEIREEYLINNSNQMAENQSSASNQSTVRDNIHCKNNDLIKALFFIALSLSS
ncbi:hypothetical protein SIXOD_v1c15880 [Spiroplasma ixodetis Y32]|nr:hypothetical protein SIXOD_v1c15880 [Spiroplasma ixodetis Y32]